MDTQQQRERMVLVARRTDFAKSWSEHDADFDATVEKIVDRVRDGKANSNGMEVVEVIVVRHVVLKPEISRVNVEAVTQ